MKLKRYNQFLESKSDMWDIIPQSVKDLHELFQSAGKKLYLVGGSVRDFLTGDKPKDFDLATDALPDEVLEIVAKEELLEELPIEEPKTEVQIEG